MLAHRHRSLSHVPHSPSLVVKGCAATWRWLKEPRHAFEALVLSTFGATVGTTLPWWALILSALGLYGVLETTISFVKFCGQALLRRAARRRARLPPLSNRQHER